MMITFPASTDLPSSVMACWGIFHPGRDRRLFCLTPDEACCIDVYEPVSQFHIAICQGDVKQCEDWVNRHYKLTGGDHFELQTTGKGNCYRKAGSRLCVIWFCLPDEDMASCVFSIAAHETLHASYAIMDGCGMKPDFANEEYVAYMQQFLMNNFVQSIGYPLPLTSSNPLE
jgi:hypothetical protein